MSLRTAFRQSTILTFVTLGAFVWLLFTLLGVMRNFDWLAATSGDFVGNSAAGGILGIVVLAILLGAIVTLYSEVSEEEPAPESWPPSE